MIEQAQKTPKEEELSIIKELEANPAASQRDVSKKLGISLGKTNYLLRELIRKGIIKGESFSTNPGKLRKIRYLLTPEGLEEKMRLISHFLKKKEAEYKLLEEDWKRSSSNTFQP